jgi:hypothetical protein
MPGHQLDGHSDRGDDEPGQAEDQGHDGGDATAPSGRSRGGTALPAATVRPVGVQTVGVHTVTVHLVATTLGGLAANQGGVPC